MVDIPGLPEELLAINLGRAGGGGGGPSRGVAGGAVGVYCGGHLSGCGAGGGGRVAGVHGPSGVQTCSSATRCDTLFVCRCENIRLGHWLTGTRVPVNQ